MRIVGIDQGTTSTRALVLSAEGELSVAHSVGHQQYYPQQGWVEHDPEQLIQNIERCIDASGDIDAIGIDNQGESCLAWDALTKEALSPVLVWQDNRTLNRIDQLKAAGFEHETIQRAGLPLDPYFSASKLAWIVEHIPAAKAAHARGTLRLGTTDAFFLDRLTDHFVTDVSTASRTSLMNLAQLTWDETLCATFGVPIDCLPTIVPTTGDFGTVNTRYGRKPVTASVVDQQAALYGFGCRNQGDAKITFGTGAFALMVSGQTIINKPELGILPTVAWQLSGQLPVYALDGGVYTASAALNWAKSLGIFTDFSEINQFDSDAVIHSGLAFVPALAGLGCPHWQPRARGTWLGLSLEHTSQQLVQAILEGIAFRSGEVIEAMHDCIALNGALAIDGGLSQNPYFVQFLADVCGREVRPAQMPELTGLGTIKLASDFIGHEVVTPVTFGSYHPKAERIASIEKFKQAVLLSGDWST